MSITVNRDDVTPEVKAHGTTWRLLRRDGEHDVGVGIASFGRRPDGAAPDSGAEAHDVPEVHYVLIGSGVLVEEGAELPLRAGDAVLTPPGRRHAIWATGDEPLVTVYVAVGHRALGMMPPES